MNRFSTVFVLVTGLLHGSFATVAAGAEPDPRPSTVAAAVEVVRGWLDEESRRDLAYMRENDLIMLHHGFGTGIRNGLGLWGDNQSLRKDCGVPHPDSCSGIIIHRLHARLRAELPPEELRALKTLDARVDKVRVSKLAEQTLTLGALGELLQKQIDAQLPEGKRFRILVRPQDTSASFEVSLANRDLNDELQSLGFLYGIDVEKRPPDYYLAPYWRSLSGMEPDTVLEPLFESDQGAQEGSVELIQDADALRVAWQRIAPGSDRKPPDVDFSRHTLVLASYGEPIPFDGFKVLFAGEHRGKVSFALETERAGAECQPARRVSGRTGIYLMPKYDGPIDHFMRAGSRPCNQANQP